MGSHEFFTMQPGKLIFGRTIKLQYTHRGFCERQHSKTKRRRRIGTRRRCVRLRCDTGSDAVPGWMAEQRPKAKFIVPESSKSSGILESSILLDAAQRWEYRVTSLTTHDSRVTFSAGVETAAAELSTQESPIRERIRQIEAKALRKMRHPTRMRDLVGKNDSK